VSIGIRLAAATAIFYPVATQVQKYCFDSWKKSELYGSVNSL